jgi:hypothetical protein
VTRSLVVLLDGQLSDAARDWLEGARAAVASDPGSIRSLFPVAGRRCGRRPFADGSALAPAASVDEAVRVLLIDSLPLRSQPLLDELSVLYQQGDTAERCAVLRALALLDRRDRLGDTGLPLVEDALRAQDTRLIRAALGEYGGRHLPAPAYRQAVLKWEFNGLPLEEAPFLNERMDAELRRMLADYARERAAAGREASPYVRSLVAAGPAPDDH